MTRRSFDCILRPVCCSRNGMEPTSSFPRSGDAWQHRLKVDFHHPLLLLPDLAERVFKVLLVAVMALRKISYLLVKKSPVL